MTKFTEHISTGKDNESFVGLVIENDNIDFYYPESYRYERNNKKKIIAVLKTIELAKKNYDKNVGINNQDKNNIFPINSYLWIINDYFQNGYYVNREKVYKINQKGKINWKKTLETEPLISNGKIIYKDVVVEKKDVVDNIMVDIHKYCLKKSLDNMSWYFDIPSSFININEKIDNSVIKYYRSVVLKELSHTFDDYKRIRLSNFNNVLLESESHNNKKMIYGVDNYYYVFEQLVNEVFGNEDPSEFYPKGCWHLLNQSTFDSSSLRPDTIHTKDNSIYIIDSKYYRFGTTKDNSDLPETSSIQKQIAYGDFTINNKPMYSNVFNIFLLPFDKNKWNEKDDIHYIGYATSNTNNQSGSHEKIYTFLVDLTYLIEKFNYNYHNSIIENMVNKIEDLINNNE